MSRSSLARVMMTPTSSRSLRRTLLLVVAAIFACAYLYYSRLSYGLSSVSSLVQEDLPQTVLQSASAANADRSLPSIVLFSLYLGKGTKLHYSYFDLTLHSMRLNPGVHFVLLHVVSDEDYKSPANISALVPYSIDPPPNFRVERLSYSHLQRLIKQRLGVHVPVSLAWGYKMAEYKPTFAHLFSELLVDPRSPRDARREYQWWGYADLDVIWGNISHFAPLFHMGHSIINSGWLAPRGMAAFYVNEPWTRVIFKVDPLFVRLLANNTHMNLDENGLSTKPENVVDDGSHSLNFLQVTALEQQKRTAYRGKFSTDRLFMEKVDAVKWAGPVRWSRGTIKIVLASKQFPAGHELMFFHRASDDFAPPSGAPRDQWIADMLEYGFLLPFFVPLLTRFICRDTGVKEFNSSPDEELSRYSPYSSCFKLE